MRIGFVTGEFPPHQGGVGDFTVELGKALAAQGHAVSVLTSRHSSGQHIDGFTIDALVRNWNLAPLWLDRWVRQQRLAVLNVQYEAAAFQMAALPHMIPSLVQACPVVVTFHDLLPPYLFPKAGPLREHAVLSLARHANAVIVTNEADRQQMQQAGGVSRLVTIPIGSNIADQPPANFDAATWRAQLDIPMDALLIGYFGFLNVSKGVDDLLAALTSVQQHGLTVYLVMIGGQVGSSDSSNTQQASEIDALIARFGLSERMRRTGYVDNAQISGWLHCCDLLVLPYKDGVSFRRGTFMAAITHGCPIITTQPKHLPPELVHSHNVWLVPPSQPAALVEAILTLAHQPNWRSSLGQAAKALSAHFTWDHIAHQTLAVYQAVQAEAGGAECR